MKTYIALLRGINVGGSNLVAMSDLRSLAASLGFQEAHTLLKSGNLVFRNGEPFGQDLETLLESETAKRLGVNPDYFVRTCKEWAEMIAMNPMPAPAAEDPSRFMVIFMKSVPEPQRLELLKASMEGPEILSAVGGHLYVHYPDGMGRSKVSNVFIERRLGVRGTARNWNTIMKIAHHCGLSLGSN